MTSRVAWKSKNLEIMVIKNLKPGNLCLSLPFELQFKY